MSDVYEPPAAPPLRESPAKRKEFLRKAFITVDCLVSAELFRIAFESGLWMAEYGLENHGTAQTGYTVGLMFATPAVLGLIPAVFLWKRWRFRWALQVTLGVVPVLVLLLAYFGHVFSGELQ